jgi:UTP--glucose-1-phosphate uridylyltransferase
VAGLGTRLLPATKTIPKEMLPIVDRPIVQHIIDEAREAGVEEFIFVTGRNKSVIEDYFDTSYELEDILRRGGKTREREALMDDLPKAGFASFTRQHAPLGLGHAVWCARKLVGAEPFALPLPDMVTLAGARSSKAGAKKAASRVKGVKAVVEEIEVKLPYDVRRSDFARPLGDPPRCSTILGLCDPFRDAKRARYATLRERCQA